MSQHDMDITTADANTGVTFRAAVNAALQALASTSSGATEPATTYAYQFWADTTSGNLKIRNTANTAWVTVMPLALASDLQTQLDGKFSATGGVVDGDAQIQGIFTVGVDFELNPEQHIAYMTGLRTNSLRLQTLGTVVPASATADGTKGDIQMDANYIYICTATNTWKRVAISTW